MNLKPKDFRIQHTDSFFPSIEIIPEFKTQDVEGDFDDRQSHSEAIYAARVKELEQLLAEIIERLEI